MDHSSNPDSASHNATSSTKGYNGGRFFPLPKPISGPRSPQTVIKELDDALDPLKQDNPTLRLQAARFFAGVVGPSGMPKLTARALNTHQLTSHANKTKDLQAGGEDHRSLGPGPQASTNAAAVTSNWVLSLPVSFSAGTKGKGKRSVPGKPAAPLETRGMKRKREEEEEEGEAKKGKPGIETRAMKRAHTQLEAEQEVESKARKTRSKGKGRAN